MTALQYMNMHCAVRDMQASIDFCHIVMCAREAYPELQLWFVDRRNILLRVLRQCLIT